MTMEFDWSGFKAFDFSEGTPKISVTANGVTFSRGVANKLGKPEYIVLMISDEKRQIVIKRAAKETKFSYRFYRQSKRKVDGNIVSVRINNTELLSKISRLMNWNLALYSYRVEGTIVDGGTILFDLNNAKIM
jgi:hypothetical protein